MATQVFSQNKNPLYGPDRTQQADAIRRVLQKTNIFQDGDYNIPNNKLKNDVWMTTVSRDFLTALPDLGYRSEVSQINQFDHHFNLEHSKEKISDDTYKISSTKGDFDKKNVQKVKGFESDRIVNWPDMAPQYRKHVMTGDTEYGSSIGITNEGLRGPDFPRINAAKLDKPLDGNSQGAQKNTHVTFGTEDAGFLSENRRMYGRTTSATRRSVLDAMAGGASDVTDKSRQMKKSGTASHVFRTGDYNGIAGDFTSTNVIEYGPRTKPHGLTESENPLRFGEYLESPKFLENVRQERGTGNQLTDYARHTTVPKVFADAKRERSYQEKVHFQFGTEGESIASVYNKDFVSGSTGLRPPKLAETPSANNIIQFDPQFATTGSTSAQVDYSYQPALPYKMTIFGMENQYKDNGILCDDLNRHAGERQSSLAQDNFRGPPPSFKAMAPRRAPRAKYDYLQTDPALPYSAHNKDKSEATDNFFGTFMFGSSACERRNDSQKVCKERVSEGKNSHFTISNNSPPERLSETQLKYTGLPKNDKGIPPAGKIETISKERFAHLDTSKNTQDMFANDIYKPSIGEPITRWMNYQRSETEAPFEMSVMKSDFKPVDNRRLTAAQQRRVEQCERFPKEWGTSHLFHTDNTGNNNFVSTATRDYEKPEVMTGPKRLNAL